MSPVETSECRRELSGLQPPPRGRRSGALPWDASSATRSCSAREWESGESGGDESRGGRAGVREAPGLLAAVPALRGAAVAGGGVARVRVVRAQGVTARGGGRRGTRLGAGLGPATEKLGVRRRRPRMGAPPP